MGDKFYLDLPDNYRYIADRGEFELLRAIDNAGFSIVQNINNAEFLQSDEYRYLENKVKEKIVQKEEYMHGVLANLLPEKYKMEDIYGYQIDPDDTRLYIAMRDTTV